MTTTTTILSSFQQDVQEQRAKDRAEFIRSLRECADFLEQHPAVQTPIAGVMLNVFVDTKDALADHARASSWEKHFQGDYVFLKKTFGSAISLEINANRELVCRRVVTGTKVEPEKTVEVVEWVCEDTSLLS